MTHRYIINKGRNQSRLFVRERVELLIELFGRCERTNIGINAPPTDTLFSSVSTLYVCTELASLVTLNCVYVSLSSTNFCQNCDYIDTIIMMLENPQPYSK